MNLLDKRYSSFSTEDTRAYALQLASVLEKPCILYLHGRMGAGKTLISKTIGEYFNISNISSASFQRVAVSEGDVKIIHCDFYRGNPSPEFLDQEVLPLLEAPWILLVEWGMDTFTELVCKKYNLFIELKENNERILMTEIVS